jgi:hypothetical protein
MVLSNFGPDLALAKDLSDMKNRIAKLEQRNPYEATKVTATALEVQVPLTSHIVASIYDDGSGYFESAIRVQVGITCPGTYGSTLVSGRTVSVDSSGNFGYIPSSKRFKENIEPVILDDPQIALALELVNFRYKQAGENGDMQWGLIAEDVDALGLNWLVDYDENGEPFGLKYDRLALVLLPALQEQSKRLADIEARLAKANL